jgi:Fe-S cluster assembly protein SufD
VNSKPELEIYADDVQCAHGATVAQLDALSLHYLRSRGVSREEAQVMLSFGFVNEVLESARLEPLRDALRPLLARRFARDPSLMRHLA